MSQPALPSITLNDGNTLPAIGFGTWPLKGAAGVEAIRQAIGRGYRLIDSACNYENEGTLGAAIRASGVPREQLRITSKLPGRHHAYAAALTCIEESLYRAQLDYFDLYLIHWPNPAKNRYCEAWQALIDAQARGLIRSIGVSNFLVEHLQTLIQQTGVTPAVNQIEMHPYFPQTEQRQFHQQHGITTEAWGPLGRGSQLLQEPSLQQIASQLNCTVAQLVLRWHRQQGVIPLPKSANPQRQQENLAIMRLDLLNSNLLNNDLPNSVLPPHALAAIDQLQKPDGRIFGLDPASHEEM